MLAFTEFRDISTLDDDVETLLELAFVALSAWSMLDDERERPTLEV